MFKSPIDHMKEFLATIIGDFANMAFDWISIFMLKPTNFEEYDEIATLYDFVFTLATSLCIVFVAWSLLGVMFNHLAEVESRSIAEVVTKAMLGFILAASAPWLLNDVLIKLNNACVQFFLDKGLDTETLELFIKIDNGASITIFLVGFVIVILFVLLSMQYLQRLGEYIVLLVTSPIAAHSIVTENFEIWSVWWRESISVVFSQAFQVMLLWFVLNLLTGTEELKDYVFAIAMMVIILKGPRYIRQFLYSSGAGKSAIGAAGGAGKMAMYKMAARRMVK